MTLPSLGGRSAMVAAILLVALAWLMVRSASYGDGLALMGSNGNVGGILSVKGQILLAISNISVGPRRAWTAQTFSMDERAAQAVRESLLETTTLHQAWGFTSAAHLNDALGQSGCWLRLVACPHWAPMPLLAIPVLRWTVRRWTRFRRRRTGRCLHCGYDLRATAEPRCPECGSVVSKSARGITAEAGT